MRFASESQRKAVFANMFSVRSMPPEALVYLKKAKSPKDVWAVIGDYNLTEDQWKPVVLDTIGKSGPDVAKRLIPEFPFDPQEIFIRGYLPSGEPIAKGLESLAAVLKYPSAAVAQQQSGIKPEIGYNLLEEVVKKKYNVPELKDIYKIMAMEVAPIDLSQDIETRVIGKQAPGLISLRPSEEQFSVPLVGGASIVKPSRLKPVGGMSIGEQVPIVDPHELYKRELELEQPFIEEFGIPKKLKRVEKRLRMVESPPGFVDFLEAKSGADDTMVTDKTIPDILEQFPIGRYRVERFLRNEGIVPKKARVGRPPKQQ